MTDDIVPPPRSAATPPCGCSLTDHLLSIARSGVEWLMAEIEDDREPEADAEDDRDPFECRTCGGSGGGAGYWRCTDCNGLGYDARAKRAAREYDEADYRIDLERDERVARERGDAS